MDIKKEICMNTVNLAFQTGNTTIHYDTSEKNKFEEVSGFQLDEWSARHNSNDSANVKGGNKLQPSAIRPFGDWYRSILKDTPIRGFVWMGIFAVSRYHIQRRSKDFYQKLLTFVDNHPNPEAGHYIERAWAAIFMESSSP